MHPLLLDLDGTLIDSRRDLASGVNRLLAEYEVGPLPDAQVYGFIGRGARSLVRRALDAADPKRTISRDDVVLRRFLGHYRAVLLETTAPFPGIVDGLERLQRAGVPLAVVTNKPIGPAMECLDGLDLTKWFGAILGGDSLDTKKPAPEMLREAADRLGVPLGDCLMVGDSDVDIEAASNAGVPGLWCAWGGIHPDRPTTPCIRVDSFAQVVSFSLDGLANDSPPSDGHPAPDHRP